MNPANGVRAKPIKKTNLSVPQVHGERRGGRVFFERTRPIPQFRPMITSSRPAVVSQFRTLSTPPTVPSLMAIPPPM